MAEAWQYHVRETDQHATQAHELTRELDRLGAEGWLLITDFNEKLIFVRPVPPPAPPQAVSGRVSVAAQTPNSQGGTPMLTVDAAGNAKFQFTDDHGDIAAPPNGDGSGLVVTFASDNPAVATFANPVGVESTDAAGNAQYLAPVTAGVDGTYNLSAVVSQVSAAPLVDNDGATPFTQPASSSETIAAGQAVSGEVSEA